MNTITIVGTITEEPKSTFRIENGSPVCTTRLGVSRQFGDWPSQWFSVTVVGYGHLAGGLAEDLHKGSYVLLSGRLDSLELAADDGSSVCEPVAVVRTFGIINDMPF